MSAPGSPPYARSLQADLADVLERTEEARQDALFDRMGDMPTLARILATADPERVAQERERSKQLQRAALRQGQWGAYLDLLGEFAVEYGTRGLAFSEWTTMAQAAHPIMIPAIVARFGHDQARMSGVLQVWSWMIDASMQRIGEEYLRLQARAAAEAREQGTPTGGPGGAAREAAPRPGTRA